MSVITLTTDFGTQDWFVGLMKGVIAGLAPRAKVIDLTHEVKPGEIRAGAFVLAASCRYFPRGTIHVVVVDPGVGSHRKAIAVQTTRGFFVGPDNGVLSWALAKENVRAIHALEKTAYFLHPVSRTFHGRDVFAPAAAHLSRGMPIQRLGPDLEAYVRLAWPEARVAQGGVEGEVVYIDRFGNGITNLEVRWLRGLRGAVCRIHGNRRKAFPVRDFYQEVAANQPVAVAGSSGFVELAVNGGSARRVLGLKIGTRVVLRGKRVYGLKGETPDKTGIDKHP